MSEKEAVSPGSRVSIVSKVPGSVTRGPTYSVGSMAAEATSPGASRIGDCEEKACRLTRVKVSSLTLVTVPVISTEPDLGSTGVMVSRRTTSGSVSSSSAALAGAVTGPAAIPTVSRPARAARITDGRGTHRC